MVAVLKNQEHPEYGAISLPLPIKDNEYDQSMKMLSSMGMGDAVDRDCEIVELTNTLPLLHRLEGSHINIDELDYLARRLDGFDVVEVVQFQAMALSGLFCGFGGVSLSMGYVSFFSRGMTAGKGFIGMSAMNLGNATPIGTTIAAFLFGMFDAMANILQSLSVPSQFIASIPYVATLIGLIVFAIQTDRKTKRLKEKHSK